LFIGSDSTGNLIGGIYGLYVTLNFKNKSWALKLSSVLNYVACRSGEGFLKLKVEF